jgi:uncharacterized protein YndB with AHSA1/START domain
VKYLLLGLGSMLALGLLVLAIGAMLPVNHRTSRRATYRASAAQIFKLITTPSDFPSWRRAVTKVEILSGSTGQRRYREVGKNGSILFEVEHVTPNSELVTRIVDPSLPFGGSWTYALVQDAGTATLTITEDGEVYNPLFRFVSRFVMGHNSTIDEFLKDLGRILGEQKTSITDGNI